MKSYVKVSLTGTLLLLLSACASSSKLPPASNNITLAPPIDVSYSEVSEDINANLGVKVRWGGQVIAVEEAASTESGAVPAKLTVLEYPLNQNGKPYKPEKEKLGSDRFVISVPDYNVLAKDRFITVYGEITGKETLTNGNRTKEIPVVAAIETEEWNSRLEQGYRGTVYTGYYPYHGLSWRYKGGSFGYYDRYYGSRYYGRGYSGRYYPHYGSRYYKRHRHF
ncbi:MAG: Slp family lipoprotein [Pseudomonadota bacterium]